MKNWLIWKDPVPEKDWRQEKGTTEVEMGGWHHRFDGHEFEQAPGVGDVQGGLRCCSPWGRQESDTTEWLNWTELNWTGSIDGASGLICSTARVIFLGPRIELMFPALAADSLPLGHQGSPITRLWRVKPCSYSWESPVDRGNNYFYMLLDLVC